MVYNEYIIIYFEREPAVKMNVCCFIGHRTVNETEELKTRITRVIEKLINENGVDTFLFGSKSQFNALCYMLVTKAKETYPQLKRVYVRAEYPVIDDGYKNYLLNNYEDTYYPQCLIGSGKAVYIKRNLEMLKSSDFCVIYYNENNLPAGRKSGTKIIYEFARKLNKKTVLITA